MGEILHFWNFLWVLKEFFFVILGAMITAVSRVRSLEVVKCSFAHDCKLLLTSKFYYVLFLYVNKCLLFNLFN